MITKDKFWDIVEKVKWEKNSKKYDLISIIILQNIETIDDIHELKDWSKYFQKRLEKKIYNFNQTSENKLLVNKKYVCWGGGDSYGSSIFKAHIVSLGKDVYESCFTDDEFLLKGQNYIENFDYIFHHTEKFAETKEGQKILHRKDKIKRIVY